MQTERKPASPMWRQLQRPSLPKDVAAAIEATTSFWRCGSLRVLSAVDQMKSPIDGTPVPTWHVSVSRIGGHPSDADVNATRRAFGMADAEEDNHEPGRARHLFLAVDPAHRAPCECNVTEETFIEPNGHRWKSPAADADRRREIMARAWSGR